MSAIFSGKQKLNLVLCGNDKTLKDSVSKVLRRKQIKPSHEGVISTECGRLISLMELPVLNQLSEEEVVRQTLRCVSLCDPGVHAFLHVIDVGPLNNNERSEIEKILKIFDFKKHSVLLFTTELLAGGAATDFVNFRSESQRLISLCGGQYTLFGLNESESSRQIPELLDYIENMKIEPYSPQIYVKAQENRVKEELEEQHKKQLSELENKIKELQQKIQSDGEWILFIYIFNKKRKKNK